MTFLLHLPFLVGHVHVLVGMLLLLVLVLDDRLLRVRLALLVVLHDGAEDDQRMKVDELKCLVEFNLVFFSLEDRRERIHVVHA